jgi:hypothetical protein
MSATAPRWKRRQSLDLVLQLNEHCLELLAGVAAADAGSELPLVSANRDLWAQLRPDARKRAALLPFVILDLHFADEAWWQRAVAAPASTLHEPHSTNWLPSELSERLVQETLMFAWQMARSDRTAAQVSFGMRPAVAVIISELMPGQVREIASWKSGSLRMRWQDDSRFWRELLLAVGAQNNEAIAELHLHAKLQLLGPLAYPHQ